MFTKWKKREAYNITAEVTIYLKEGNEASVRLFEKNNYFNCANYKNVGEKFGKILGVVYYEKELD